MMFIWYWSDWVTADRHHISPGLGDQFMIHDSFNYWHNFSFFRWAPPLEQSRITAFAFSGQIILSLEIFVNLKIVKTCSVPK